MFRINWNQFRIKNQDYREAFEQLCYHLFCRKFKISEGISGYKNQIGIEKEPIKHEKDWIGFQSKFFDHKVDPDEIIESLKKAKEKNTKLNKVILYINGKFTESSKKGKKESITKEKINTEAKTLRLSIEWIVPSNFEVLLSQPVNSDLAQSYFGIGDEFGFVKSCCEPNRITLLESAEYIDIPFVDDSNKTRKDIKNAILSTKESVCLIVGHPGSGKSVYMHKLLQHFGGLDKTKAEDMRAVINKNKALPMLINLKDCLQDSLENIIRNRQVDYKLRNNNLGMVYLFDGLDELDEEKADKVLTYMVRLSQAADTRKIVLSCRSGNTNRLKAKVYFSSFKEYEIACLSADAIKKYFKGKNSPSHEQLLNKLGKNNPDLINKITDILFAKLLWDTIPKLNDSSTVFDLIENKIKILLNTPFHRKNIDSLNVLNPKPKVIIELNKEISFAFFKRYQFRFSEEALQKLILRKFIRIDYESTNRLLNYLSDMFFDGSSSDDTGKQTYIYHHRSYQEYFFAQKLKDEYENDQKVLRDLRVLSNQEFFNHLFLPLLRREYEKEHNLCRLLELNLIDVYLGRHRGWGADDPYYADSSEFVPALARQDDALFAQLLDDETLQIKQKLSIDVSDIKAIFEKWEKDRANYRYKDSLKGIWESGIASLLNNIVTLWENKKFILAKALLKNIDEIIQLYKEKEFRKNLQANDQIKDPFWERWEDWLFVLIVIRKKKIESLFSKLIRKNYPHVSDVKNFGPDDSSKAKLIQGFFRVCLRCGANIFGLFDKFDDFEKILFLKTLSSEEFLPVFINTKSYHSAIKKFIEAFKQDVSEDTYFVLFYKTFFGVPLSGNEKKYMAEQLDKILQERPIDWQLHKLHLKHAVLSYAAGKYSFAGLREDAKKDTLKYYNELRLYAALFDGFVRLLEGKETIEGLLRDYLFYIETFTDRSRLYLQVHMSFLWAYIFTYSKVSADKLIVLKQRLVREENKIIPFSFLYKLINIDTSLFNKLTNEYDIAGFENELETWNDDYPSFIERCLGLASFYSEINNKKAEVYIAKAINEGMLRHGWRKDSIVSYLLVEALEILWRNNWISKDVARAYAEEVFNLALRVADITDGKGTWQGPYNVIELVANYDIEFAETLKSKLIEKKGRYNIWNWAITAVILAKVKQGVSSKTIEEDMKEYSIHYDYENKPRADYYEQKFRVYLTMAQSNLYTDDERKEFFNKAYEQIETIKEKGVTYYLKDDFEEEKKDFLKLCEKYGKTANVILETKDESLKTKSVMSENQFISTIKMAKTKRKMLGLYEILGDYNKGIVLKTYESWKSLVNKTFEVTGSTGLFIDLLQKNLFPHTDFMTSNSKYFHLGLAEALNNINTKEETLRYLYGDSGHGGFLNIMKAYEINRDKDMCLKLFQHFLKFCKFLVY